ncbi:MAG: polyphosphate:AMP phosphotransferase [Planctomycetes bacterium]|nr:polyphosphate:AMP phosphotransferase [Planctomycetota bacterium]MCB9905571.1 polyphosphate:AMP phosphotransferase [Planctomycetota bacterium]
MLDDIVVGNEVSKDEYERVVPALREELVELQYELRDRGFAVLVHLVGTDSIGCEEIYDRLHVWMDARYLRSEAFDLASEEERERPLFWRYWRALPRHGLVGIHYGAWSLAALAGVLRKTLDEQSFDARIEHVQRFEKTLVDDGTLLVKLWLHVPKKVFKQRLDEAASDPATSAFVDQRDWNILENYDELIPSAERYISRTDTAATPWTLIESSDARHRDLTVARTIRDALRARLDALDERASAAAPVRSEDESRNASASLLSKVDLSSELEKREYKRRLVKLQARLHVLSARAASKGVSTVLAFEGWDAAGKGGAIRRITNVVRARFVRVVPIAAPTEDELAHHYLWRFWQHLPRAGRMLIFDRSWYGRVLVERVEGYAAEADWRRAYSEINDFEASLAEHDVVFLKFWLHISEEEQLRRFKEREATGYKRHKITEDDYRNRAKRADYVTAVDEMVRRTSTDVAPWHLIAAEDKRWARIQVLERLCEALDEAL